MPVLPVIQRYSELPVGVACGYADDSMSRLRSLELTEVLDCHCQLAYNF